MTCREAHNQLSAWVDGELSPEARHAVDEHLAACPNCRAHASAMRALKHAVARLSSRETPPGAVQARVAALRFQRPRHRQLASVVAALVSLAAVLAITVALGRHRAPDDHLSADQLVADHLRSVAEPVEIASDDPEAVTRFFRDQVAFLPIVPRLAGSRLKGGRLCLLAGTRSELLFYDLNGDTVSLFVGNRGLAAPGCEASGGLQVCERRVGDVSLMLVGEQPPEQLARVLAEAQ
jgi:anti-sigma factor RsiW